MGRLRRLLVAALAGIIIGFVILLATSDGLRTIRGGRIGGDLPAFYGAARIVRAGETQHLYDPATQEAAQKDLLPVAGRVAFAYPPYGHLIRVVCSAANAGPELAAATEVRELVAAAGVPALGPAPLFRRQARWRVQLVVRSRDREPAIAAVRAAVERVAGAREHGGVAFAVDVDPQ